MTYWLYAGIAPSEMNRTTCMFKWPKENRMAYVKLWIYFQLCIGLLIPLAMISTAYVLLSLRLKHMLSGTSATSGVKKPSREMMRTVSVVVTTFLVCQTPFFMMEVWALLQQQKVAEGMERGEKYTTSKLEIHSFLYLNVIAQMLVFISSSVNPILYGLMNDNYRKY